MRCNVYNQFFGILVITFALEQAASTGISLKYGIPAPVHPRRF